MNDIEPIGKLEKRSIVVAVKEALEGIVQQFPDQTVVIKKVVVNLSINQANGGGAKIVVNK